MVAMTREQAVAEIREICSDIGCSMISNRCKTHPHECSIIRKIMKEAKSEDKETNDS